jgi:hypothetical protein
MEEAEKVVIECRANNFDKAALGWEWSYEVDELAKELAKKTGLILNWFKFHRKMRLNPLLLVLIYSY